MNVRTDVSSHLAVMSSMLRSFRLPALLALAVAQAPLTRALTDHLRKSTAQLTVGEWLNSADAQLRENATTRHIWATHEPTVRKVGFGAL